MTALKKPQASAEMKYALLLLWITNLQHANDHTSYQFAMWHTYCIISIAAGNMFHFPAIHFANTTMWHTASPAGGCKNSKQNKTSCMLQKMLFCSYFSPHQYWPCYFYHCLSYYQNNKINTESMLSIAVTLQNNTHWQYQYLINLPSVV